MRQPPTNATSMGRAASDARIGVFVPGDGLGDGMMRIPFLRAIQKKWPDHKIWWVAAGATALTGALKVYAAPYLEQIQIGFNAESPLSDMLWQRKQIPSFDVIFNFYTRTASVLMLKWVLLPRLYYTLLAMQLGSSHRDPRWRFSRPKHMLERVRSMAIAAGCELPPPKEVFNVGFAARKTAARLIPGDRRAIAFATGSSNSSIRKNWPLERFIAVARQRAERGDVPLFLIGPSERGLVDSIRTALPGAVLAELDRPDPQTGAEGVELAIAIGERLSAAVMNDAGLAHVLAVADVPQVVLFGPTSPNRWAPDVRPSRIVRAQDFGSEEMEAIPSTIVESELECLLDQPPEGGRLRRPSF